MSLENRVVRGAAGSARGATPAIAVALLILGTSALRLLFAASIGLGIDESYMVAAGRRLAWSYFDHPPLAWWLAWAAAHLFGREMPIVVRLPFILLFALSTWLMYRLTAAAFGRPAGLWAAAALNLGPEFGVTAASWVLPDGPLFAALLGAALCLNRAVSAQSRGGWGWWLGAGSCAGLALLSKYSAGLTIIGAIIFLLSSGEGRRWLGRPQPYAAGFVALALFTPVPVWNASHGWVSFVFQSGRAVGGFHPWGPVATTAGAALFVLPWLWLGLVLAGWEAWRRGRGDRQRWLFLCLAAPPILFFTAVSLSSRVLYHWTAPGYLMLMPLLGAAIAGGRWDMRSVRRWAAATAALVVLGAGLVAGEVRFAWLPRAAWGLTGGHDPALAAIDWRSLRREFAARGLLARPGLVVAATRWLDAGKIDYALGGGVPVLCLGSDPRQYGIIAPLADYAGEDVLIVAPHTSPATIEAEFGRLFDRVRPLPPATLMHAGHPAASVPLFIGEHLHPPR